MIKSMKTLVLILFATFAHAETIHVTKQLGDWNLQSGSDDTSEFLAYEADGSAQTTRKNDIMKASNIRTWVEDQKVRFLIGKDYIKLDDVPDGVSFDLSYTPGIRKFKASEMTAQGAVDGSGYAILGSPGPKPHASCRSNGVTWMLPMVLLFLLLKRKEEV